MTNLWQRRWSPPQPVASNASCLLIHSPISPLASSSLSVVEKFLHHLRNGGVSSDSFSPKTLQPARPEAVLEFIRKFTRIDLHCYGDGGLALVCELYTGEYTSLRTFSPLSPTTPDPDRKLIRHPFYLSLDYLCVSSGIVVEIKDGDLLSPTTPEPDRPSYPSLHHLCASSRIFVEIEDGEGGSSLGGDGGGGRQHGGGQVPGDVGGG